MPHGMVMICYDNKKLNGTYCANSILVLTIFCVWKFAPIEYNYFQMNYRGIAKGSGGIWTPAIITFS